MKERTKLLLIAGVFIAAYYIPWDHPIIRQSGLEAFMMLQEYARKHVLTCLIPAFFIAGAISVFVSQGAILKYFGAQASKILSYSVASVSGSILAVCSCTVLPLFCRHLHAGSRHRPGNSVSLFRTSHQCPGHHPHSKGPRLANGSGTSCRSYNLCDYYRLAYGPDFPKR